MAKTQTLTARIQILPHSDEGVVVEILQPSGPSTYIDYGAELKIEIPVEFHFGSVNLNHFVDMIQLKTEAKDADREG